MPKFSIEEHEKRMRELLQPKSQGAGSDLLTMFKEFKNKRKALEIDTEMVDLTKRKVGGLTPPTVK